MGESAPSTNHMAAVPLAAGKDPRHPNHPDYALHQQIRDKTEALCESHGIPLTGDQLDRVAACLTADAKRVKISSADHVLFSERPGTQEIGENLIVAQGALDKPGIRYSIVAAQEAAQTPIAQSFDKLTQVNQTQAMQQQQLAQEQQQEQSRSAHRMMM
jgi:hypothetical protein